MGKKKYLLLVEDTSWVEIRNVSGKVGTAISINDKQNVTKFQSRRCIRVQI